MFCVSVTYVVQAGKEAEAEEHLRRLEAGSNLEPGCLLYKAHRSHDVPRTYFIYEQYVDEKALFAHRETAHFENHATKGLMTISESRVAVIGPPLVG